MILNNMSEKGLRRLFWGTTIPFCLFLGIGGVLDIILFPQVVADIAKLGYPEYFVRCLGFAKIAGCLTLLYPKKGTLKEWAYAGFTIDLVMAVISHAAIGDYGEIIKPVIPLVIMTFSYVSYTKLTTLRTAKV